MFSQQYPPKAIMGAALAILSAIAYTNANLAEEGGAAARGKSSPVATDGGVADGGLADGDGGAAGESDARVALTPLIGRGAPFG